MAAKKVVKLQLDVAPMIDDFFEECSLLGIAAEGSVVSNIWKINQVFNVNFARNRYYGENNDFKFDLYQYHDNLSSLEHAIFSNRKNGFTMIPQYIGYSLLWLIRGHDNRFFFANQIKKASKQFSFITAIREIEIESLEQRALLLY